MVLARLHYAPPRLHPVFEESSLHFKMNSNMLSYSIFKALQYVVYFGYVAIAKCYYHCANHAPRKFMSDTAATLGVAQSTMLCYSLITSFSH
jgi:hypothetical protein